MKFNTHRDPQTGKRACVLVNLDVVPRDASLRFDGNERGAVCVYRPFEKPQRAPLPVTLAVPAERLAIVVEH